MTGYFLDSLVPIDVHSTAREILIFWSKTGVYFLLEVGSAETCERSLSLFLK